MHNKEDDVSATKQIHCTIVVIVNRKLRSKTWFMHSSNKNATISCSFRSENEAAIPKFHVKRTRGNVKINLSYTKNNYPHVNENRRIQTRGLEESEFFDLWRRQNKFKIHPTLLPSSQRKSKNSNPKGRNSSSWRNVSINLRNTLNNYPQVKWNRRINPKLPSAASIRIQNHRLLAAVPVTISRRDRASLLAIRVVKWE